MSFEKQALSSKLIAAAINKASPKKLHSLPILERLFKKEVGNIGEYSAGIDSSVLNNALGSLSNRGLNNPAFSRILNAIDSEGGASAKRYLLDRLRRDASIYGNIGRDNLSAALNNTANLAEAGAMGAFRAPFNGITTRAGVLSGGGYDAKLIGRPYSDSRRAVISLPDRNLGYNLKNVRTKPSKDALMSEAPRIFGNAGPITRPRHPIPPFPPPPPRPPMPPRYNPQPAPTRPAFRGASLIPPRPMLPPRPPMPSPWPAAAAAVAPIAGGAAYMANN